MDEAAATSCMEKLLADFEPCQLIPLVLQTAAESQTPEIQVHRLIMTLSCKQALAMCLDHMHENRCLSKRLWVVPAQVAALRAATEYAVLSEGLGTDLCSVMATILRSHCNRSPNLKPAALSVTLEALRAGGKLLESFPGMQEGLLGPIGNLASCAGIAD